MDQKTAIKRCMLKRYLSKVGIVVPTDLPTDTLQGIVRHLHKCRSQEGRLNYAWPLNDFQVTQRVDESHYLRQLVAVKKMFGKNSGVGCLDENGHRVYCRTVKDLVAIGFVPARYSYLDFYIKNTDKDLAA